MAKKQTTIFLCESCGNEANKWTGQCPNCKEWNTLKEFSPTRGAGGKVLINSTATQLQGLDNIEQKNERILSGFEECDRVLGGGFVSDSFVLLTGDPGVGKSTLSLQVAMNIAAKHKVLYFSGEESVSQISSRAKRLFPKLDASNFQLASETSLESIVKTIETVEADFVVVDSIQTIASESLPGVAGSASQVRFCAEMLMHTIKKRGIACVLIGHVTKGGDFAGPQTLAHLVDTVLYLEGDRYHELRMLRGQKNRFGTTSELGVFEMVGEGLKEVENPSEAFLEGRLQGAEGSAIVPLLEGSRPFLVELQALSSWTNFGYPKRTASGVDINRLHLMLAVLEKHGNIKLDSVDVFVNVVGGMKIQEPAADLALLMAVASSKNKKALPEKTIILGEVGLSGEVRTVSQLERRLKEAEKMGFETALVPKLKGKMNTKLDLKEVKTVQEALRMVAK